MIIDIIKIKIIIYSKLLLTLLALRGVLLLADALEAVEAVEDFLWRPLWAFSSETCLMTVLLPL